MQITIQPAPFDPVAGYTIEVHGGTPPYAFDPLPSPPNPKGVQIAINGNVATVTIPGGAPSGAPVEVVV